LAGQADETARIAVQPWMGGAETKAVIAALEAAGGAGCARFVGGCVRNAVIGRPVSDIDIATPLTPDAVMAALKAAGLKALPTGVDHGTVTAVARGKPFEITTLRRDVETDGRHAVVAFTTDWTEDAMRRDFRLNALYAEPDGRIHDPTGRGVADARAGRIVFVGDPQTRILEDGLRILRFFRFYAWYGRGEPDAAGLAACAALKDHILPLSHERVSKEVLALLAAEDPRPAVRLMAQTGVLAITLPMLEGTHRFEALVEIETDYGFAPDAVLRLAALLPRDPINVMFAAEKLRLSNAQRQRLVASLGTVPRMVSWMSPRETRRAVYKLGWETFRDRAMLAWAQAEHSAGAAQWRALLPMAETWPRPSLPLSGEEVMAAGVPEGPRVGEVLREVEDWWIDQDFPADKLAVIEQLKAVAQGMVY
jgi:poly(A) polymerase